MYGNLLLFLFKHIHFISYFNSNKYNNLSSLTLQYGFLGQEFRSQKTGGG